MNTGNLTETVSRPKQTCEQIRCPECGEEMKEVERCTENGALFVWFECSKENCDGQWLQKRLRNS